MSRRSECGQKIKHKTLREAHLAARVLTKQNNDTVTPYRCRYCKFFHIGHSQPFTVLGIRVEAGFKDFKHLEAYIKRLSNTIITPLSKECNNKIRQYCKDNDLLFIPNIEPDTEILFTNNGRKIQINNKCSQSKLYPMD
jgi:hypothetical protein